MTGSTVDRVKSVELTKQQPVGSHRSSDDDEPTTPWLRVSFGDGSALCTPRGPGHERGESAITDAPRATHQETYERVYGMVSDSTKENRVGQSKDAQLGNIEEARCRVEASIRLGETTLHRRSETFTCHAHEGAPRLQVPSAEKAEDSVVLRVK